MCHIVPYKEIFKKVKKEQGSREGGRGRERRDRQERGWSEFVNIWSKNRISRVNQKKKQKQDGQHSDATLKDSGSIIQWTRMSCLSESINSTFSRRKDSKVTNRICF